MKKYGNGYKQKEDGPLLFQVEMKSHQKGCRCYGSAYLRDVLQDEEV